MAKIGLYGGSFNPVHTGHVQAAGYAMEALGLDQLIVIPASQAPGKQKARHTPSDAHRLAMLKLAFSRFPQVQISDLELVRGGISYTRDTVLQMAEQFPGDELILFMGTDMFLSFLNWYCPEQILQYASIGVFYRGEKDEEAAILRQKQSLEAMGGCIYLVKNPVTAISSTELRKMLVFGCANPYLPTGVGEYIHRERLYGTEDSYRNLSEEALETVVLELLKPNRVAHVLGCRQTAVDLACRWNVDPVVAARAALLHDITKALDGPLQEVLCDQYGICESERSPHNRLTIHSLTGSYVADRIFGESEAVVKAIACHTTGKTHMNVLEKIIYVADYIEPNREFPGVQALRELAYTNLDGALTMGLEMTISHVRSQGREVSTLSLEALDYLNHRKKDVTC